MDIEHSHYAARKLVEVEYSWTEGAGCRVNSKPLSSSTREDANNCGDFVAENKRSNWIFYFYNFYASLLTYVYSYSAVPTISKINLVTFPQYTLWYVIF